MKMTKKAKLETYDELERQAGIDSMVVHILATGEEPDFTEKVHVAPGESITGKVYRALGAVGGYLTIVQKVAGQKPQAHATSLEAFLRHQYSLPYAGNPYKALAEKLHIARNRMINAATARIFTRSPA